METFSLIPLENGAAGFRLVGELDLAAAPTLADALAELEADGPVVLDLEELTFIDSSGVHAIFNHALSNGSKIVLSNPSPEVVRTLEILGISEQAQLDVRLESGR